MDFKKWFQNADMPTRDKDGKWFDLEDGISFEEHCRPIRKSPSTAKIKKKTKLEIEIETIQSKDWKTLSIDEKNHLYDLIKKNNKK
jgi:hypothetical protein